MKAYERVKVDPENYLQHLRVAYSLPALTYDGVYSVDLAMLDHIAEETIRGSMRIAAAEGAGPAASGFGYHRSAEAGSIDESAATLARARRYPERAAKNSDRGTT